ncbi:MAG: hypothetical protein JSV88_31605 [Candidatus Aminicenantes bacterium]|nr:MAG: hypothetical protein JSV88_31605 [Candidatus Aminicenantes bacterium]
MQDCPYPRCSNNFIAEYSMGNCPQCKQVVLVCPNCQGLNRQFARFCRLCGGPIEEKRIEKNYFTQRLQKKPYFILNKFANHKLSFIDPDVLTEIPYIKLFGNRIIIISGTGVLYDWDFFARGEPIIEEKVSDNKILIRPLIHRDTFYFASGNTLFSYNLLSKEKPGKIEIAEKSLSFISIVKWQEHLYGLFLDVDKGIHTFGKIDTGKGTLDNTVKINDRYFSPHILPAGHAIFLFSKNAVYAYKIKDGIPCLETLYTARTTGKNLNISARLWFDDEPDILYIPGKTTITRLRVSTGQFANFVKNLQGIYYVLYTCNRVIISDDNGLHIFDYNGRTMAESRSETFMRNLSFNSHPRAMKAAGGKLLFAFASQYQGGGFIIPWRLDNPKVASEIPQITGSRIPHDLISNIDISRNFAALIHSGSEVLVWQF